MIWKKVPAESTCRYFDACQENVIFLFIMTVHLDRIVPRTNNPYAAVRSGGKR